MQKLVFCAALTSVLSYTDTTMESSMPNYGSSYHPTPAPAPNSSFYAPLCSNTTDARYTNCCDPPKCTQTNENVNSMCTDNTLTCVHYTPNNGKKNVFISAVVFYVVSIFVVIASFAAITKKS